MRHRQDDTRSSLQICTDCDRAFVIPGKILDLIDGDRAIVELACTNCGATELGVFHDDELLDLDRRVVQAQAAMQEALDVFALADELERIDRFAEALRDDLILPEDF